MGNCQKASLILAWCCVRTLAVIVEHHPVLEGSSTTLVCAGNASGDRSVYWKAVRPNQISVNISTCPSSSNVCEENNALKYNTSNEVMGGEMFKSSLTISNITSEDGYYSYECVVANASEKIQAWKLSKVFYGPDGLNCTGSYVRLSNTINITCLTSKVYPGFICEFVQMYNQEVMTKVASHNVYNQNLKSPTRYTPAMCSVAVPINAPGIYHYHITGYAGFNVSDRFSTNVKFYKTNEVDVSPSVVIEQQTSSGCPEPETPLLFWCTTYLVSSPVTFMWSFTNGGITKEIHKPANKSGNNYRSMFELTKSESRDGMTVTCMVNYETNSRNKSLKHSISLLPTTLRPYFTHSGTAITTNVFSLNKDDADSTFKCQLHDHTVQDGRSAEVSLNVSCHSKDEPQLITNIINHGDSVTFTIQHRNIKQGLCKCSVYQSFLDPKCYNSTAHFTFFIPSETIIENEGPGLIYVIYYAVAGTIGFIMLIVIMGICLFLKSRWSELYTIMNIYFSVAGTTDGRTSERNYESVKSFFRGFSSEQPDRSRASDKRSHVCHGDNGASLGLTSPPFIHTRPECDSDIHPRLSNSGCTQRSGSYTKKTTLQHKVHQYYNREHKVVLSEDAPSTVRLIHNRPPPLCFPLDHTPQKRNGRLAKIPQNEALDESSSFSHGHVIKPRSCTAKKNDRTLPTKCRRLSSSPCSGVSHILDHDCQPTTCPETSDSEASCYKRNMLSLPSCDPEKYFVPISSPRHKQVAQPFSTVNRRQENQLIKPRVQLSKSNAPLMEDSQSISTPAYSTKTGLDMKSCGADHSNIATVSNHPLQTVYSSVNSSVVSEYMNTSSKCYTSRIELKTCSSLLAAPYLYEIPDVLSDGSHRWRTRKQRKRRTQSGDYSNIYLEPDNSKSRSYSNISNVFQKGNLRRHRNTRREKKCAYENIQINPSVCPCLETRSLDTDWL